MAAEGTVLFSRLLARRLGNASVVRGQHLLNPGRCLSHASMHERRGGVLVSRSSGFHQEHRLRSAEQSAPQSSISSRDGLIVRSPHPDVAIPDDISLAHLIINNFPKYKNSTALVDGVTGQEMTYSQLHTSVAKAASAFAKLGLRHGDVVTIFSPNCPEFAIAALAIAATGAAFSTVNPLYTTEELKNALVHVKSRFLITVPFLLPVAQAAVKQCQHVKEIIVFGEGENCRPFSDLLKNDTTQFPENVLFRPRQDVVALPFSSGTTGLPKGVMLSHYNIVANILQSKEGPIMGYEAGNDCILAVLPFFHIYGQVLIMLTGLFAGAKVVTLPNFRPLDYLEAIRKYRPTYLHLAPPLMLFLAKHPAVPNYDLSTVRNMIVGAAPVANNVLLELLDRINHGLIFRQAYGLTETSPLTHINNPETNRYETVGPAIHNTKYKIVDIESRRELLGPGKSGEICIRGPQVMLGYYENQKSTEETIIDGWIHSGDSGHYEEDGHLIIDDRIKELIKVKGYQVAPAELEAVLLSHPSVQDAAVVGRNDEKLGEAPVGFVVLRPQAKASADELKQYVAERVAPYKKLAGGINFCSEIPKTPSGKILRRTLRSEINQK